MHEAAFASNICIGFLHWFLQTLHAVIMPTVGKPSFINMVQAGSIMSQGR